MITCCMTCRYKNDDYYHKGREGGGQRVMIEIIISENDDNDGRPLRGHFIDNSVSFSADSRKEGPTKNKIMSFL